MSGRQAGLLLLGGLLASLGVVWADLGALQEGLARFAWPRALVAALLYLAAHGLRVLRLLILLGDAAGRVRDLAAAHAASAALSAWAPFKLGELARWWALASTTPTPRLGLLAAVVERAFDAVVLWLAASAALWAFPDRSPQVGPLWALSALVLLLAGLALFVAPGSLALARLWLARRYTAVWTNRLLRALLELEATIQLARARVNGREPALLLATLLVWGTELAALSTLLPGLPGAQEALVGLLALQTGSAGGLEAAAPHLVRELPVHHLVLVVTTAGLGLVAALGWPFLHARRP